MTAEDRIYAETLNMLGSDVRQGDPTQDAVHRMHDRAENSHGENK